MTNTLQKRFVVTAMIAISILLAALLAAINIAHYVLVEQQVDRVMHVLTEVQGTYTPPDRTQPQSWQSPPEQTQEPTGALPRLSRRPTPDDMMGARHFSVLFDGDGAIIRTNINQIYAVTDQQARQIASQLYGQSDGRHEQFLFQSVPLSTGKGSLMLFLDISSQRESILTVLLASCAGGALCWLLMLVVVALLSRRAIAPIARNMEQQKQFVTNAGHEIKTPLAIILANTDALELHNGQNKWSSNIRTQVERLNDLMNNLLTLSKMDEEGVCLPMGEFAAHTLLEELMELYLESARARGLTLDAHIAAPVSMTANRDSITQLFSILLDNAVKYAPSDSTISITLERSGSKTVFQVSNPCPLLPSKDPERLFDRFYRGDTARTQSSGGCGIGLSAARSIAQAHGGTICAQYNKATAIITFRAEL